MTHNDDSVDQLLDEFQQLRLLNQRNNAEELDLLNRIVRARSAERAARGGERSSERQKQQRDRAASDAIVAANSEHQKHLNRTQRVGQLLADRFPVGARVYITNEVKKPVRRRFDKGFDLRTERFATVTRLDTNSNRVWFVTVNNNSTNRDPKYLCTITEGEYQQRRIK